MSRVPVLGRPDACVSAVTGCSAMLLGRKTGALVVVAVVGAVAVAVADGQNQSVEVKSLTGQLSSTIETVLGLTVLTGTVLGTKVLLGEDGLMRGTI